MSTYLFIPLLLLTLHVQIADAAPGQVLATSETRVMVYRDKSDRFRDAYFRISLNYAQAQKLKWGTTLQLTSRQSKNVLQANDSQNSRITFNADDHDTAYIKAQMKKGDRYYLDFSLSNEKEYAKAMRNQKPPTGIKKGAH